MADWCIACESGCHYFCEPLKDHNLRLLIMERIFSIDYEYNRTFLRKGRAAAYNYSAV